MSNSNENPPAGSDRSNLRLPLFAVVVAAVSFATIFYVGGVMLPKTEYILRHSDYPYVSPWFIDYLGQATWIFYSYFIMHCLAGLAVAAVPICLIAKFPVKLRTAARRFLLVTAPALFLIASASLFSGMFLTNTAHHAQLTELRNYRRTLAEFALEEAAAGRLKEMNDRMRLILGHEMVIVDSVDDLSRPERREQVARLTSLLKKQPDSPLLDVRMLRKLALATLVLFRDDVRPESPTAELVLLESSKLSGTSFVNLDEAFDWIASQDENDGWEAMPLMHATQRQGLR